MRRWDAIGVAAGASCRPPRPAPPSRPKPLFAGNELIRLTISGPISLIASKAEQSRGTAAGHAGADRDRRNPPDPLSARGITRRKSEICQFPPLRDRFHRSRRQRHRCSTARGRLKLVTHCRKSAGFQQYVLLEYAAYRLFNR